MASARDFYLEAQALARALYLEARDLLGVAAQAAEQGTSASLELAVRLKEDLDRRIRSYLALLWRSTRRIGLVSGILTLALFVGVAGGWDGAWMFVVPIGLCLALVLALAYPVLAVFGALNLLLSRYPTFKREIVEWPVRLIATVAWSSIVLAAFLYAFPPSRFSALGPLALLAAFATALGGYLGWGTPSPWLRRRLAFFPITLLLVSFLAMQLPLTARAIRSLRSNFDSRLAKQLTEVPAALEIASADDLVFADAQTGEPRIWYAGNSIDGYALYASPGYDRFGEELEPADTPEEHESILAWYRARLNQRLRGEMAAAARERREQAETAARSAAEARQRELESMAAAARERREQVEIAARSAADAHQKELETIRRLAGRTRTSESAPGLVLALAPAQKDVRIDVEAAHHAAVAMAAAARTYPLSDQLSRDQFTSSPYFARLRDGDLELLREAGALHQGDHILAGIVRASCEPSSRFEKMVSCKIELRAERLGPGGSATPAVADGIGPGFDESDALGKAVEVMLSQHGDALLPRTLKSD